MKFCLESHFTEELNSKSYLVALSVKRGYVYIHHSLIFSSNGIFIYSYATFSTGTCEHMNECGAYLLHVALTDQNLH